LSPAAQNRKEKTGANIFRFLFPQKRKRERLGLAPGERGKEFTSGKMGKSVKIRGGTQAWLGEKGGGGANLSLPIICEGEKVHHNFFSLPK